MSDELITEFRFVPVTNFKYAKGGEQVESEFITLFAPAAKYSKECSALKQAFFRALPRDQDNPNQVDTESIDIKGDDIIIMLSMSKDVDLPEVMEIGMRLLSGTGLAMIDGEIKLNKNLIDNMQQDDVERMIGEYLVNFILASSLIKMKEASKNKS